MLAALAILTSTALRGDLSALIIAPLAILAMLASTVYSQRFATRYEISFLVQFLEDTLAAEEDPQTRV